MGPQRPPRSSRLRRLLRGWRPDRNPLRRRSDRVEAAIMGLLFAAFLAGAPLAWHFAGKWAYPVYEREAQVERALVHEVPATLLRAEPGWSASGPGADVEIRWKAPDGQRHTAAVFVPDGAASSGTVMVWITRAGQLTDPPLQQAQVMSRAQLARVLAVIGLAVTLLVAGMLTHQLLVRRRLAAWGAEWLAKGPDWRTLR
jgi:hypothetical protein